MLRLTLCFALACAPDSSRGPVEELQQRAVADWRAAPERVAAEVAALPDPLARLAVVIAVSEAHPGTTEPLCALLEPADRARCTSLNRRPHLRALLEPDPPVLPEGEHPDPGGLAMRLALAAPPNPFAEVPPAETDCAAAADPNGCAQAAAARLSSPAEAAAVCNGVPDPGWRDECYFRAAELPLDEQDWPGQALEPVVARAAALCLGAGRWQSQCLQHLSGRLGALTPVAGARGDPAWPVLAQAVGTLGEVVEAHAPGLGPLVGDKAWATLLWMAVQKSAVAAGGVGADLPPEARPHLRCAVAARLVDQGFAEGTPLAQAEAALAEALARVDGQVRAGQPVLEVASTWGPQADPHEGAARVHYLADPMRLLSADPDSDGRICLLEAGMRAAPPRGDWLAQARADPDLAVRRTVARLAGEETPPPPRRPRGGQR